MRFSQQITLPEWSDRSAKVAASYWAGRGYTVSVGEGPSLHGVRGSAWGTLIPFFFGVGGAGFFDIDWRKLASEMRMTSDSRESVLVDLELTPLLSMSRRYDDWALEHTRLEVIELQHVLCGAGDLSEVWGRFTEAARRATRWSIWTKGLIKRPIPEDLEDEIAELEVRFLLGGGSGGSGG
jgi:hypothetical protein